jgi:hypothetical protein
MRRLCLGSRSVIRPFAGGQEGLCCCETGRHHPYAIAFDTTQQQSSTPIGVSARAASID